MDGLYLKNWDVVKREKIWAKYSKIATEKVKEGDEIIFYVVGRGVFGGIFKVADEWYKTSELKWVDEHRERKKPYPYEAKLQTVKLSEVDVRLLSDKVSFLNVNYFWLRLMGTQGGPANHERPISIEDYELIVREMKVERSQLTSETTDRSEIKRPTHEGLKSMLKEIGYVLGFVSKTEEYRTIKVFEVELSGNVDHALSSLSHAHDVWGTRATLSSIRR